jgi:hypothetical protein
MDTPIRPSKAAGSGVVDAGPPRRMVCLLAAHVQGRDWARVRGMRPSQAQCLTTCLTAAPPVRDPVTRQPSHIFAGHHRTHEQGLTRGRP